MRLVRLGRWRSRNVQKLEFRARINLRLQKTSVKLGLVQGERFKGGRKLWERKFDQADLLTTIILAIDVR